MSEKHISKDQKNRMDIARDMKKEDKETPESAVARQASVVSGIERIARFRGRPMLLKQLPYPHFIPLSREKFDQVAYPLLGGLSRSRMGDIFSFISNTMEDLSGYDNLILFGLEDMTTDEYYGKGLETRVWDCEKLEWSELPGSKAVWRCPYGVRVSTEQQPVPFIMSLAGGDAGLYEDIMQSLAPLVMARKPDGVIWWVGDGANGKSTLMDALYRLFPGQLASITVKRLTDGRDTPSLNGTLANIVKESSEGRIDDTEIYKAIGTHEDFRVHKFHSQDDITIRGNLHHIFSANSIPTFNDKGWSARRRTFIIPFTQRFESDPTFEERTFTPKMFGHLIQEMCRYAVKLRDQGYRYKFSAITLSAKEEYDTDANNAEEYAAEMVRDGLAAFDSFHPIRIDYENWCADHGYVPLGVSNLRRAMQSVGYERQSTRLNSDNYKMYRLPTVRATDLLPMAMNRPGMYTARGFVPTVKVRPSDMVPEDFDADAEKKLAEAEKLKEKMKGW